MELGIVAGFAYWGVQTGDGAAGKLFLGVAAPAVGFTVWGTLDFRGTGGHAELFRLVEELVISGLAALALTVSGQVAIGVGLAVVSAVHHVLVYAIGDRLLKPPRATASPTEAKRAS